ncbi:TolC family protein [Aquirufa sp. KTFRIE-69F]|uniref:TolC family protein n=1 Tax=Aquirufa originis TaxID=3096514 RepID=A0ABW6D7E6_9BACT
MRKIALLTLLALTAQAQTNRELNTLVQQVLTYSPIIKAQKTQLQAGEIKTQIQGSYAKPIVAYEAGITRIDPVSKVTFATGGVPSVLQFQPNMNYNTNFVASQTLYDWGKNKSTIDKILLETRLSQTQIDQTAFGLAFQIATVYHQILFLQNVVTIQKAELGRINSHKAIVENQIKLGEALELDVMGLRIRAQNQETKITETETQIDKLIDFLQTQSGQKGLKEQIKAILQANTTKGGIDQHPSILSLEAEKSVFEQEIAIQSKASTPTLAGSATLGVRNGYLPRINGEVPAFEDDFKLNSLVGIKLTVPIYSGKRASMQQSLAKIQQERIAFQKDDTQTKLAYELRQGQANLSLIQDKLATQKKVIDQAKYAYQLGEARYKEGTIKQLELDQIQNLLEEAQLQEENFKFQFNLQQLDLLKTQGVKFWEL